MVKTPAPNYIVLRLKINKYSSTQNLFSTMLVDTTKRLMSSPKCRSVEVINNQARPGSNHREVNYIIIIIISLREL